MTNIRVLGVDLASSKWSNNGSAVLTFSPGQWTNVSVTSIDWPTGQMTAQAMADAIDAWCTGNGIAAVSLDGPQGWRDPNADPKRKRAGRSCEYEVRAQGKTKTYGLTAPQTQCGWITFCIDVFAALLAKGTCQLANDPEGLKLEPPGERRYWLLECFPTSIWRASGLSPLPGKQRVGKNRELIGQYAAALAQVYGLPLQEPFQGSHDDLQAIVCALPAAGLLGGPAVPLPKGEPASDLPENGNTPAHRVEGIIWDAKPVAGSPGAAVAALVSLPKAPPPAEGEVFSTVSVDERDEASEAMLARGVELFDYLVDQANAGECLGIGYADFACFVHGVASFDDIAGRSYKPGDSPYVVNLAGQVTEAAGGRKTVKANGEAIEAGMDTFVWPKRKPHERADVAFRTTPYTQEQWRKVFPAGQRRLLTVKQFGQIPVTE